MSIRKRWEDVSDIEEYEFCDWVANWVCRDDFAEDADWFAELACRKLYSLGLVEKTEEDWKRSEEDETD